MSRMAAVFLLAATAGTTAGTGPTAEEAGRRYRAMTAVVPAQRCATGDEGEIVVCGGRDERARQQLPLPEERGTRDGSRRESGDRPAASAAPVRQGGCGVADRGQLCGGGYVGASAAAAIVRAVRTAVDPDGISEPEEFRPPGGPQNQAPVSALSPR